MIVHSILSHHPAHVVDAMAEFLQALGNGVRFCLAYGGEQEEFEKILFEDKIFLADPGLRGKIESQNFSCWFRAVLDWAERMNVAAEVVHFTECDHIPLRPDYWSEIKRSVCASGKDFLGKWCMDRTNTNEQFSLHYRNDPAFLAHLRALRPNGPNPIWGALANGMTFRLEAIRALCNVDLKLDCFTEILIPSTLRCLGFELGDFDEVSSVFARVRHRPEFLLSDVSDLLSQDAWCCHPFKNIRDFSSLFENVLGRRQSRAC